MNFAGVPNELKGSLQENLITLVAHSDKHCRSVVDSVPLKLWSNEAMREIAVAVYAFIEEYGRAPKDHLPDLLEGQILKMKDEAKAEMMVTVLENIDKLINSGGFNEDFVVSQLSHFVGLQKLKVTVVDIVDAAEQGDLGAADIVVEKHREFREQHGGHAGVELLRGDTIRAEAREWLWPEWLERGAFHVLAGDKGTGKTTVACSFAAAVSNRKARWPDNSRIEEPLDVLFWSGEDSISRTLVPRLLAANADMSRVHFITAFSDGERRRAFDPATDMAKLAHAASKIGSPIGLTVIDSIVSAVSGDSHKNAEVRRGLQPVLDFGEKMKSAVFGITHLTKGTSGRNPVERVTGSLAFAALARVLMVTVCMREPDEHGRDRILTRAASNIGPDGGGFYYTTEQVEVSQ